MTMKRMGPLFALPLAAMVALAADPWNEKKVADWNEKDVKRLQTKSPWAKEASVDFDSSRMGMGGRGGMGGPGMGGGMGGPGGGPGGGGVPGGVGGGAGMPPGMGGGMPGGGGGGGLGGPGGPGGMEGGGPQMPKVMVLWQSAEPMREAAARAEAKYAAALADQSKEFYIIATSGGFGGRPGMGRPGMGGPGMGGPGMGGMDPSQREEMRKQMEQRMLEATSLTAKGKLPINPAKIVRVEGDEGQMMTFFMFPRSPEFTADDKEVTFQTSMGPVTVRTKFLLKEMVYQGKLSL